MEQLLLEARDAVKQSRTGLRLRCHLLGMLICFGLHTITGVLRAAGRQFGDWTADYRFYSRDRVDVGALFATVRRGATALLTAQGPLVLAMDDSILRKRGKRVPNTAWQRDPTGPPFAVNWVWGQRVLQLSLAVPCGQEGAARTLPVDFIQAPAAQRPGKNATEQRKEAYKQEKKRLNINRQGLGRLEHLQQQLRREGVDRPMWVAVDGRFTNSTVLKGLGEGLVLIGRIRQDAKLHRPPGKRSRKRCYGQRLPTPQKILTDESIAFREVRAYAAGKQHTFRVKVLEAVRWRAAGGKRTLQLIVIAPLGYRLRKRGKLLYRKPAYLICTDASLPVEPVLQAFLWRWEEEVNFRDEKTVLGVGARAVWTKGTDLA